MCYLVATKGRPKTDWERIYSAFGFWKYRLITKSSIYKVYYWFFLGYRIEFLKLRIR